MGWKDRFSDAKEAVDDLRDTEDLRSELSDRTREKVEEIAGERDLLEVLTRKIKNNEDVSGIFEDSDLRSFIEKRIEFEVEQEFQDVEHAKNLLEEVEEEKTRQAIALNEISERQQRIMKNLTKLKSDPENEELKTQVRRDVNEIQEIEKKLKKEEQDSLENLKDSASRVKKETDRNADLAIMMPYLFFSAMAARKLLEKSSDTSRRVRKILANVDPEDHELAEEEEEFLELVEAIGSGAREVESEESEIMELVKDNSRKDGPIHRNIKESDAFEPAEKAELVDTLKTVNERLEKLGEELKEEHRIDEAEVEAMMDLIDESPSGGEPVDFDL